MSDKTLNPVQLRVLGSLLEKETTTPEYYPMTLNALVAACNQKSNRWPVTNYDESELVEALRELRVMRYAAEITGSGMRVAKYAQRFTETLNLGRRETAVLCVLFLRGPQTIAEIKDRTERMHAFADLDQLELLLQRMSESKMTARLERVTGQKESRYAHLFGGPVDPAAQSGSAGTSGNESAYDKKAEVALELAELRREISQLRAEVAELRDKLEAVL